MTQYRRFSSFSPGILYLRDAHLPRGVRDTLRIPNDPDKTAISIQIAKRFESRRVIFLAQPQAHAAIGASEIVREPANPFILEVSPYPRRILDVPEYVSEYVPGLEMSTEE